MNRGPPTRALTRFSKTINDQQSTINDQLSTVNDQAPATRLRGSLGPWGRRSTIKTAHCFAPGEPQGTHRELFLAWLKDLELQSKHRKTVKTGKLQVTDGEKLPIGCLVGALNTLLGF